MNKLHVFYLLSEECQKRELLRGQDSNPIQHITIPLASESDKSLVKSIVELTNAKLLNNTDIVVLIGFALKDNDEHYYNSLLIGNIEGCNIEPITTKLIINYKYDNKPYLSEYKIVHKFNKKQTLKDLYGWEKYRQFKVNSDDDLQKIFKVEETIYSLKCQENEYRNKLKDLSKEISIKENNLNHLQTNYKNSLREKAFIYSKGSDYLQKLYTDGYDYVEQYIREYKDSLGLTDFFIDVQDNASYNTFVTPSMETMEEVKKYKSMGLDASIVHVTHSPSDSKYNDYLSSDELATDCILIKNFAKFTDLFKKVE